MNAKPIQKTPQAAGAPPEPHQAAWIRIARDLHDGIGQVLTGLKLDVAWIDRRLSKLDHPHPAIVQRLEDMRTNIDSAIDEVRRIAHGMVPGALEHRDLGHALETQTREFAHQAGLRVVIDRAFDIELPAPVATEFYRVAQEAMTNIARHAKATTVWVSYRRTRDAVELRIRDDGIGISRTSVAGSGLRHMRERAKSIGATLQVKAAVEKGTVVILRLPSSAFSKLPKSSS